MKKALVLITLLPFFLFQISCKKTEFHESRTLNQIGIKDSDKKARFFRASDSLNSEIISIIEDIKKQDSLKNFVGQFSNKNGFPLWESSVGNFNQGSEVILDRPNQTNSALAIAPDTSIMFIPVKRDDVKNINTIIACAKINNRYYYKLLQRQLHEYRIVNSKKFESIDYSILTIFALFEKRINKKDQIEIGFSEKFRFRNPKVRMQSENGIIDLSMPHQLESGTLALSITFCIEKTCDNCVAYAKSTEMDIAIAPQPACWSESYDIFVGGSSGGSGSTGTGGTGTSGDGGGSAGGGSGGSVGDGGFICPITEWWCESGEYRILDGQLVTPDYYPFKSKRFPWLWTYEFLSIEEYSVEAKFAAKTAINQEVAGLIESPTSERHIEIFNSNVASLGCCPTGPVLTTHYISELNRRAAFIKRDHPEWSKFKCYREAIFEIAHVGLDILGLFPVGGEVFDVANGVIYSIQGDGVNATLSFSASVPFIGWGATGAKYALKTIHLADGSRRTLTWYKTADGLISFGKENSEQFRKILDLAKGDPRQAHHIIPWELAKEGSQTVIQLAAQSRFPFHVQDILNGIPLSSIQHYGPHDVYTRRVREALEEVKARYGSGLTPEIAKNELISLTNKIRTAILNNPNLHLNDIVF